MTCAICTASDVPGRLEPIDGRAMFVCSRCSEEHPRAGGYSFGGGEREDRMELASGCARSHGNGSMRRSRL